MNADDPRDRLAEFLGEELDARGQDAITRHMAGDPSLAAEADGLQRALGELRRLDPVADAPGRVASGRHVPPRPRLLSSMLRRAAIILLAFVAGFGLRSTMPAGDADHPDPAGIKSANATPDWTSRAARVYMRHQDKSSLTRALIAVTQSGPMPDVTADR